MSMRNDSEISISTSDDVTRSWECCTSAFGNRLRFYAFSVFHVTNFLANVSVVLLFGVDACRLGTTSKLADVLLLCSVLIVVGIYNTTLALRDEEIKTRFGDYRNCWMCACLVLGFTQLIQVKVARRRYDERERQRRSEETPNVWNLEAPSNSQRILSAQELLDAKKYDGILEGCVFASVLVYAQFKVGWYGDHVAQHMHDTWSLYVPVMISGTLSFLNVGMCMLNLDYQLSPHVVKPLVDNSFMYTVQHATFRACEAGSRIMILVLLCLCFRGDCNLCWRMIPALIIIVDYALCTGLLFYIMGGAGQSGVNTRRRWCYCLISGLVSVICNLTQFMYRVESGSISSESKIFSRFVSAVHFVELAILVILLSFDFPCKIPVVHEDSQSPEEVGLLEFVLRWHTFLLVEFVLAAIIYYVLRVLISIDCFFGALSVRRNSISGLSLPNQDSQPLQDNLGDALLPGQHVSPACNPPTPSEARGEPSAESFTYQRNPSARKPKLANPRLPELLFWVGMEKGLASNFLPPISEDREGSGIEAAPRVNFNDFEELEKLGEGGFGTVTRCRHKATKNIFAMKRMEKTKAKNVKLAWRERQSLVEARGHRNIASLEFAFHDDSTLYFILEYCDRGSLKEYLEKVFRERKEEDEEEAVPGLDPDDARRIGLDILEGLEHLHQLRILHRDLKPANVGICSGEVKAKLIDFGLARSASLAGSMVGSHGYAAPEIIAAMRTGKFRVDQDCRVDLYAFGRLLFVALVGMEAHVAVQGSTIPRFWTHNDFREMLEMPDAEGWFSAEYTAAGIDGRYALHELKSSGARATIKSLTETNPCDRVATASAAKQLPFFVHVDGDYEDEEDSTMADSETEGEDHTSDGEAQTVP